MANGIEMLLTELQCTSQSLRDLARGRLINNYVSRMVNLTTLAPDIVAAILDDALPHHVTLFAGG